MYHQKSGEMDKKHALQETYFKYNETDQAESKKIEDVHNIDLLFTT